MKDDPYGVVKLRTAIDQVAADLPTGSRPAPFVVRMPAAGRIHPNLRAALAAGIVLLLLGYPAYLGLRGGRSAPGPVGLYVLSLPREPATLRSAEVEGEVEKLRVVASRPLVLVVEPDPRWIEPGDTEAGSYLLEIRDARGDVTLSVELAPSRLEHLMEVNEGIPLLIPARKLVPGRYELRLARVGEAAEKRLSSMVFEISPP